ncbi:MAG: M48 family metallopeptidase [Phaeodactylibacter sp.]|nr:M48 family metallopeptidase [Phaeodactylibacter sp.]
MKWKRKKQQPAQASDMQFDIEGQAVPVKVYREARRGARFYLGKRHAILRLPIAITHESEQEIIEKFHSWLARRVKHNEGVIAHYEARQYKDGDTLQVGQRSYLLRIRYADRKTHSGKLEPGNTIRLSLSKLDEGDNLQKNIRHLLSRIVAQDFLPEISNRVQELNKRFFQKPIREIRLKHTHSRLGSCSTKGIINLSTRLLFAPQDVIDYIIIHELAHLVEMNHSPRFWKAVEQAMPNYREKEQWIKDHLGKMGF